IEVEVDEVNQKGDQSALPYQILEHRFYCDRFFTAFVKQSFVAFPLSDPTLVPPIHFSKPLNFDVHRFARRYHLRVCLSQRGHYEIRTARNQKDASKKPYRLPHTSVYLQKDERRCCDQQANLQSLDAGFQIPEPLQYTFYSGAHRGDVYKRKDCRKGKSAHHRNSKWLPDADNIRGFSQGQWQHRNNSCD